MTARWILALLVMIGLGCTPPKQEDKGGEAAASADAGAKGSEGTGEKPVATGEAAKFSMALGGKPRSLDPGLMTDNLSAQIGQNCFEGLTNYPKSSDEDIQPGVAESWKHEGFTTWTFTLRKDAKWSNGDPVTAQDFVYSWQRVLDKKTASEYAWIMIDAAKIKNAGKFQAGELTWEEVGVKAPDDYTLVVELEGPAPFFIQLSSFFTFLPVHKATVEQHGEKWTRAENWVSNGPFALSEQPNDLTYILKRNDDYWDKGSVSLETVEMRVIEDDSSRVMEFDAGGIDWTGPGNLPPKQIDNLKNREEYRAEPALSVEYIQFNVRDGSPFAGEKGAKLRKAIALSIDKSDIVKNTLKGIGRPAKGFVPRLRGYKTLVKLDHDPEAAKKLLDEAFPGGAGLPEKISYLYPSGNANAEAVAEVVQNQLDRALGIKIELQKMEFRQVLEEQQNGNFQISRAGWIGDYTEPSTFLSLFTTGNPQNNPGWSNTRYDDLMAKAPQTLDDAERVKMYQEMEQLLDVEAPVVPIFYHQTTTMVNPAVKGFEDHIQSVHLLKYISKGN